jgi:integrase
MGVKIKEHKGAWWVFIDHKRQRRAKRVGPGTAGKRAAETIAKQYEVQLALGTFDFDRASPLALQAYAQDWLGAHGRTLKLSTREKYAEIFRVHWFPALGDYRVADITRAQIKAVVAEKARTYARGAVSYMVDVLRSCLHAATEDGIIAVNPAARLGALAAKGRKAKPVETFTAATLAVILDTAKVHHPGLYPLVLLLARTGLRLGEALALQVRDIQVDARTIQVRRTWGSRRRTNGPARFNVPKGGAVRRVDMSKQLTAAMKVYVADRADPEGWVFPGQTPEMPMQPVTFLGRWTKLLRKAGVTYRKPHTLRHTYASLLIQNG